jgi:integrase
MALAAVSLSKLGVGRHHDRGGLYLQVKDSTSTKKAGALTRSWLFRYTLNGKAREMGLGAFPTIAQAKARAMVDDNKALIQRGIDPIEARQSKKLETWLASSKSITFKEAAMRFLDEKGEALGHHAKHRQEWGTTLQQFVYPIIGALPVAGIGTAEVLDVLRPIWKTKTETASRVRGRIERILGYATVNDWRNGDNPARWKGHLSEALAAPGKITKKLHHPALPFAVLPSFYAALKQRQKTQDDMGSLVLEWVILTACRLGDVTGSKYNGKPGACWEQIEGSVWTIPSTKTGRELRVPLCDAALALLEKMEPSKKVGPYIFPGRNGASLQDNAIGNVITQMNKGRVKWLDPAQGDKPITAHGFRSTFSTWAAEKTDFPYEIREAALGHTVGNAVANAYQRGDLLQKRHSLMQAWGEYATSAVKRRAQ